MNQTARYNPVIICHTSVQIDVINTTMDI